MRPAGGFVAVVAHSSLVAFVTYDYCQVVSVSTTL